MSKEWDLSCTCAPRWPSDPTHFCLYCKRKYMSADWLHDDNTKTAADHVREAQDKAYAEAPATGYHTTDIPTGVYGESSKIMEEVLELQDAEKQGLKVMALIELTDIVGACEGYLTRHYPGTSMDDVLKMARATSRAFTSGRRTPKPPAPPAKSETRKTKTIEECWRCGGYHLPPDDCPQDPGPAHP